MKLTYWNSGPHPNGYTTEELIEIASNMTSGEDIEFTTPLTSYMDLSVNPGNEPLLEVSAFVSLQDVEGISATLTIDAAYTGLVDTRTGRATAENEIQTGVGYSLSYQEVKLNIHDIVKLFHLTEETRWDITNHGTMLLPDNT